MFLHLAIALCGLAGFGLCLYIITSKHGSKTLVCPLEGSCDTVIHSKHSVLFGIPLEILGICYYSIVFFAYGIFALFIHSPHPLSFIIICSISGLAFLLSVYLVMLQAFVLKHWCTWCLVSAGISVVIFILSIISAGGETYIYLAKIM
jgi:uncharacterized membrane protein